MTLANKLQKVLETKASIRTAIEDKGVEVGDAPFDQYPDKIRAIESGSACVDGWQRPCCWAPFPEKSLDSQYFMGLLAVENTDNETATLKWDCAEVSINSEKIRSTISMPVPWQSPSVKYGAQMGRSIAANSESLFVLTSLSVLKYRLDTNEFVEAIPLLVSPYQGMQIVADNDMVVITGGQQEVAGQYYAGAIQIVNIASGQSSIINNPATATSWDRFGATVALNNTYLYVAAPDNQNVDETTGTVYVFNKETLELAYEITNPLNDNYSGFGNTIEASDDYVAIGAPNTNNSYGAVAVFNVASNSSHYHTFQGDYNDFLGRSLSINSNIMAVGLPDSNKVYLYDLTSKTKILTIDPGVSYSQFGYKVTATESFIFIAAPDSSRSGYWQAGQIYMCDYNGNVVQTDNTSPEIIFYGTQIGLSGFVVVGDDIISGSPFAGPSDDRGAGGVYRYDPTTLTNVHTFSLPDDINITIAPDADYISTFSITVDAVTTEAGEEITWQLVDSTVVIPFSEIGKNTVLLTTSGLVAGQQVVEYGAPLTNIPIEVPAGTAFAGDIYVTKINSDSGTFVKVSETDFTITNNRVSFEPTLTLTSREQLFITTTASLVTTIPAAVEIDWGDGTIERYPRSTPIRKKAIASMYSTEYAGATSVPITYITDQLFTSMPAAFRQFVNLTILQTTLNGADISVTIEGDNIVFETPLESDVWVYFEVEFDSYTTIMTDNDPGPVRIVLPRWDGASPLYAADYNSQTEIDTSSWVKDGNAVSFINESGTAIAIVYFELTGIASHTYNYNSAGLISNLTGKCAGYKQAIVTLTALEGKLRKIDISSDIKDELGGSAATPWLDVEINAAYVEEVWFYPQTDSTDYYMPI